MKEPRSIIRQQADDSLDIERPIDTASAVAGRYPQYREFGGRDGINLMDYWRAVRKRLWLVIGIAVLATTLTAIYMARKPSIYQARSVVQVDLETVNEQVVVGDRQRATQNSDPAYFNTQLQLLNSESLIRRVIKEHNLDTNKDILAETTKGSSVFGRILSAVGLSGPSAPKDTIGTSPDGGSTVASKEEIADAARLSPLVEYLKLNLAIEPRRESRSTVKDTRLIDIAFRNQNPVLAADVANAVAETFTAQNQEKRSGTSRKTNDFLQERIAELQSEIQRDEERLQQLTQQAGIVPTDGDQTLVIDQLSQLNKQLLEAENARKTAEAAYNAVSGSQERIRSLADAEMQRYVTEQENSIRNLQADTLKKIGELRQQRDKLLQEYHEGVPEIQEIDAQIRSYQGSLDAAVAKFQKDREAYLSRATQTILSNLQTKYLQAKGTEDKLRASYNQAYNLAQSQNGSAVTLKLLKQTIDTNKGFLDNLRKQVSGNDVAAQGSDNNISLAEIAVPPDTAISPRRLTSVAAAFLLSTLFGIGLALFLEYLDDTIRSTDEIENYLGLPALAAIPTIDATQRRKLLLVSGNEADDDRGKTELLIDADPRSSLAEAYRQLRTSILLSTAGHAPKSLLITSSLPAEGKTTTATNTAISLAQTGAKVLIIDADMRRPRLHSVFDIPNDKGLSTLLSTEAAESEIHEAISQDPQSKLYLMPSGPIPPNPAELIGSDQMSKLLKFLQGEFSHVVVDSPPIASFTDGVLIASMVDGVILVVHAGKSSRQVIKRSRQLLNDIGARVFGVVLNNVNLRGQDNSYYYQSYYHRDNYNHDEN